MVELIWDNKQEMLAEINSDIFYQTDKELIPCIEESKNFDNTENLYIEGDNLDALKLLKKDYENKIKMIYIDPPYNTEKKFIYNDTFRNKKKKECRHSGWLNMMYPRLRIAKELLCDDGAIFISIGQAEESNLTKICNEIFNEVNRVGIISRMMKSGGNKGQYFSPNMEYILVYAKNIFQLGYFREPLPDEVIKSYNRIEETGTRKGERYSISGLCRPGLGIRPNQRYWVECPDGTFVIPRGVSFPSEMKDGSKILPSEQDTCWRWSDSRYLQEKKNGNVYFAPSKSADALIDKDGNTSKWNVFIKTWLSDRLEEGKVPSDLITKWENRISSSELNELSIPFDFAKPSELIKHLIDLINENKNAIILDFFSGSATTAHAVMQLNAEDDGKRKFIMIQLPELCDESSEAFKNGGFTNICELGKERIRRAAKKIHEDKPDAVFDDGFKVFKLI